MGQQNREPCSTLLPLGIAIYAKFDLVTYVTLFLEIVYTVSCEVIYIKNKIRQAPEGFYVEFPGRNVIVVGL
jgi:hypothetical protein